MNDLWFWVREIFATILFFIAMALVCVLMVLIFPDPTLWRCCHDRSNSNGTHRGNRRGSSVYVGCFLYRAARHW